MIISEWLTTATSKLSDAGIESARLDAELILAHVMGKPREWVLAHGEFELNDEILKQVQENIKRRTNREPLAYILGFKEFYGRKFIVTPDVLIPRPETEVIVDVVKNLVATKAPHILDIGTGSGAIAITLKLELPKAEITATDISDSALLIANKNRQQLDADVRFIKSDLLDNVSGKFDIITANLPYVDRGWSTSPETAHEPEIALFADDNGLMLVKKLIKNAPDILHNGGYLVLEIDSRQIESVKKFATQHNFTIHDEKPFTLTLKMW